MANPAIFIAALGGILPALLWLAFWLLEDRCQPEPKRYIFYSFLLGGLMVPVALYIEKAGIPLLDPAMLAGVAASPLLLCFWAATEEVLKFGAAYLGGLRSAAFDEPLDAVVYMVTAALGFSSIENTLFLFTPVMQNEFARTVVTGSLRFIGASLLHTLTSATIGVCIALAYSKPAAVRRMAAIGGVILAITLHTLFNFFILGMGGGMTFWVFLCVWFGIIATLLMVERVKQPQRDYC